MNAIQGLEDGERAVRDKVVFRVASDGFALPTGNGIAAQDALLSLLALALALTFWSLTFKPPSSIFLP